MATENKIIEGWLIEEINSCIWDLDDLVRDLESFKTMKENMKEIQNLCNNDCLRFYKDDMLDHISSKKNLIEEVKEDIVNKELEIDEYIQKIEELLSQGYRPEEDFEEMFESICEDLDIDYETESEITIEIDNKKLDLERFSNLMKGMYKIS